MSTISARYINPDANKPIIIRGKNATDNTIFNIDHESLRPNVNIFHMHHNVPIINNVAVIIIHPPLKSTCM